MPKQQKDAMVALIKRCDAVVSGEVDLLANWANQSQVPGRSDRCLRASRRIHQSSGVKSAQNLAAAKSTPAVDVCTTPDATHNSAVKENERNLAVRSGTIVDRLSGPMFTRFIERCERNAKDAVKDQRAIYKDSHCSGANP